MFALGETLAELTYAAQSQTVAITGLRSVLSAQELTASGAFEGKPLRVFSYSQLQARRLSYYRTLPAGHVPTYDSPTNLSDELSLETAFRQDRVAFIVGNSLGLYPRPEAEVRLMVHRSIFLTELVNNNDTNYLLDYAFDVVTKLAVRGLNAYLRLS